MVHDLVRDALPVGLALYLPARFDAEMQPRPGAAMKPAGPAATSGAVRTAGVRRHWGWLLGVAGLVLVVDQAAKATVRARLPYGDTTRLGGVLRLHHTRNAGLLGGTLQGAAVPVGIATVVALVLALRYYGTRTDLPTSRRIACGLLLGGTLGNLADRLRLGYVTDFIARNDRNAFNLADLAIYAGLALMVVFLLAADRSAGEPARL
jgi:signal peptidase II